MVLRSNWTLRKVDHLVSPVGLELCPCLEMVDNHAHPLAYLVGFAHVETAPYHRAHMDGTADRGHHSQVVGRLLTRYKPAWDHYQILSYQVEEVAARRIAIWGLAVHPRHCVEGLVACRRINLLPTVFCLRTGEASVNGPLADSLRVGIVTLPLVTKRFHES